MCPFLGLTAVIAMAVFMLQAGTLPPGAPDVCEEPCAEATTAAPGVKGYRAPLVVRQRVPAQMRGGVYMPAHETYVVLQPGHWEPQGAAEDPAAATVGEPTATPETPEGCRRFGKQGWDCDGGP